MTKRQGLLLALVLASGSTLLTYIWYSHRTPTRTAAKPAPTTQGEADEQVAIQPAGGRPTAGGFKVPRHQRAVSIEVDATRGAGALARSSDHVDILLAANNLNAGHLAETIIQDVPVLGPTAEQAQAGGANAANGKRQLVVSVSPHDAQRLIAAQLKGSLVVTLRNPSDREYAFVRPVVGAAPPKPAAAPKPAAVPVAKAPAPRPARRVWRRSYRPGSMASMTIPPEPIPALPALPSPDLQPIGSSRAPAASLAPAWQTDARPQKTIEVVKGTAVQTITVKE